MLQALKQIVTGPSIDPKDVYANVREIKKHTPDLSVLEQYEYQLLFVYDEMQKDHRVHSMIKEHSLHQSSLASCYTVPLFTMWKKNLGLASFPIPLDARGQDIYHSWFENEDDPKPKIEGEIAAKFFARAARIKGELYAVRPYQIHEIDKYKQNREHFLRRRVKLILPYKQVVWTRERPEGYQKCIVVSPLRQTEVWAHMYVGVDKFWREELDHRFTPVRTFVPKTRWLGRYYDFSKLEYNDV